MAVNPGLTQKTGRMTTVVQKFTGNGRMVNIKGQENQRKKELKQESSLSRNCNRKYKQTIQIIIFFTLHPLC